MTIKKRILAGFYPISSLFCNKNTLELSHCKKIKEIQTGFHFHRWSKMDRFRLKKKKKL